MMIGLGNSSSSSIYIATMDRYQRKHDANMILQVIEYLVKKGYNRTEQMLRQESSNLDKDGRPISDRAEDMGNTKYAKGFRMLSEWIDQNLDIYKVG